MNEASFNTAMQLALLGKNLLIIGQGGSGKSAFVRQLQDRFERDGKSLASLAPTHMAARGINGWTFSSAFPKRAVVYEKKNKNYRDIFIPDFVKRFKGPLPEKVNKADCILIDEFGMIRADDLTYMDHLLKHHKKNDRPFGGVQVIGVGDYKQIPPVLINTMEEIYYKYYKSVFNFTCDAFIEGGFMPVYFAGNGRIEVEEHAKLLQMIREQKHLNYVANQLNKIVQFDNKAPDNILYIAKMNWLVEKINNLALHKIPGEIIKIPYVFESSQAVYNKYRQFLSESLNKPDKLNDDVARAVYPPGAVYLDPAPSPLNKLISYTPKMIKSEKDNPFLSKIYSYQNDTITGELNAEAHLVPLRVKINAKVIFTQNVRDGTYTNGEIGYIKNVQPYKKFLKKITILKEDGKLISITPDLVPVEILDSNGKEELLGWRYTYPFQLAYALTFHKTQGRTLHEYFMDTKNNDFLEGMTYVGLSRATNLSRIHVNAPIRASDLKINPEAMKFYEQLGIS